jgi:succinate dehydrogenase / fumarate reductase cytochrome b subunit
MSVSKNTDQAVRERPLSPHLQIYRWQLTMSMSILHRACGLALAAGIAMVVWMLVAAATGPDAYGRFSAFAASGLGRLMIFGWSAALCYHMCNGVRHLFWDMGYLFKIENAYRAGYIVLACAALMCAAIWLTATGG